MSDICEDVFDICYVTEGLTVSAGRSNNKKDCELIFIAVMGLIQINSGT